MRVTEVYTIPFRAVAPVDGGRLRFCYEQYFFVCGYWLMCYESYVLVHCCGYWLMVILIVCALSVLSVRLDGSRDVTACCLVLSRLSRPARRPVIYR